MMNLLKKPHSASRLRAAFLCLVAAGATALMFFSPPHGARAQYVDQGTWGGTTSGSANAQSITIPNYYSDAPGVVIRFIPGFTNTGPATISINGRSPVALQRPSLSGLVAFSGQEFVAGVPTAIVFTGSVYKLDSNFILTTGIAAGPYVRPAVTFNAAGQATAVANGAYPTYTKLNTGSGTYNTPAGAKRLRVRMKGGGGGSGGAGTAGTGIGGVGGTSSFGSTTAVGGSGGGLGVTGGLVAGGGIGGTGGTTGTGTEIIRTSGQAGFVGAFSVSANAVGTAGGAAGDGGPGGSPSTNSSQPIAPPANSGGGAASVTISGGSNTPSGGGGGGGEYVQFVINNPAATYSYAVATGGAAGSGTSANGAVGAAGLILIEELYD